MNDSGGIVMDHRFKLAAVASMLALTGGCATIERGIHNRQGYYTDNTPDLSAQDVSRFAADQSAILDRFVILSGVPAERRAYDDEVALAAAPAPGDGHVLVPLPATYLAPADGDWRPAIDAGMHYVDVRCQRYVDALFALNRIREGASRELRDTGAASAAALTILHASMELIGLAPLAFGLLDQTVNNVGRGLLYDLPPTVIQTIVREQQTAYVNGMANQTYRSRAVALRTIQGYAALCLPTSIETEVNRAIADQRFHPVDYSTPAPKPPAAPAAAPPAPAAPTPATAPPVIAPN